MNEVRMGWMFEARLSLLGFLLGSWISFSGSLPVRVVFFPSLPFMGVMLFPSFWLGNAPGEGDASLALLSLFLILLPPLFFLYSSLFSLLLLLLFPPFFFFSSFHLFPFFLFLSFSFVFCLLLLLFFFFFEGTACTVCFQDVGDDAYDCNPIVIRL